jgi:predicted nuclease with TOPRIM domain
MVGRGFKENNSVMATTIEDVWQILAQVATSQAELTSAQKETDRQLRETDQRQKETAQQQKETDRQLKELGKQIGGLGSKFGSFTEGLALPSMESILRQRFGMEIISSRVRASHGGQHMEIDVLAYANGSVNTAYIVEVKSHPREEAITQLKTILQRFRTFFPEHRDKQLYGILAAVDLSPELREKILREGLYVARIHDQVFELDIPENFHPQTH